jgi:hypothetical protein
MPYQSQIDMPRVLRATLAVLEQTAYEGKNSKVIAELKTCLREAILNLETLSESPSNGGSQR